MKVRYRILPDGDISRTVRALKNHADILQVDVNTKKHVMRIVSSRLDFNDVAQFARKNGIELSSYERQQSGGSLLNLSIAGMTCQSCEILIEKKFKSLPGVRSVSVNAHAGSARIECDCEQAPQLEHFQNALASTHYRVTTMNTAVRPESRPRSRYAAPQPRISGGRLLGFFLLAFAFSSLLSRFGVFNTSASVGDGMTLGAAFVLGLIAATSSCLATVGGLLLTSLADASKNCLSSSFSSRAFPTITFVLGRLLSYTVLGGLIGVVGSALAPSPVVTGGLVLVAAAYMIIMGLDMLGIAPPWLKACLPKMPKAFARHALSAGEGSRLLGPGLTGAATFFVPCGFTQALQLYALTLGDPVKSAALLGMFALGTTPMLSALGFSFNLVKGKTKQFVFHFAGALIIIMGFANIQNGFAITGYPLSFDWVKASASQGNAQVAGGPLAPMENGAQVLRMSVSPYGYSPNQFTVKTGVPVKWIIDGSNGGGCAMALQSPALGVRKLLTAGENVIDFTPPSAGSYLFSCAMGMYRGTITVVNG